jgi:hypothetical protein
VYMRDLLARFVDGAHTLSLLCFADSLVVDLVCAVQGTPRARGGILLKMADATWRTLSQEQAAEVEVGALSGQALFPFQERCLQKLKAGGRGQNWLVVIPTGAGKTRVFVEHAR